MNTCETRTPRMTSIVNCGLGCWQLVNILSGTEVWVGQWQGCCIHVETAGNGEFIAFLQFLLNLQLF